MNVYFSSTKKIFSNILNSNIGFKGDFGLLVISIALSVFGLLMIFSASSTIAYIRYGDTFYYFNRQLLWLIFGFLVGYFFYRVNLDKIKFLSYFLLFISYGLMIFMLPEALSAFNPDGTKVIKMPFVVTLNGATRWYDFGFLSIQPSELFKLSLILVGSYILCRTDREKVKLSKFLEQYVNNNSIFNSFLGFIFRNLFFSITLFGVLLVFAQRDLDTIIVILLIYFSMVFVAATSTKQKMHILKIFLIFVIFGFFSILLEDFRRNRVLGYLEILLYGEPSREFRDGVSFQFWNGLVALGSGGLFGVGYGESRQKLFFLQDAAFTDSIFAIIGEEFGLLGTIGVILSFLYILSKGIEIAKSSSKKLYVLIATGVTTFVISQAFLNISANLGVIPFAGMALPFLTYGGSNTIVTLTSIGILINISKRSNR
ncbi:MAG: FtsW/RodA/SpoVE family cell cycle protein [Candidatus Dojkabacteria bacterium]|nr:FtsW/RodA/SpoVE family cell cycle protein [Candidatus Dojkabacteria bacterium]